MSKIAQLLVIGKKALIKQQNPLLEAQILLAHVLNCEQTQLYSWADKEASLDQVQQYETLLQQRQTNEPMAYILGYKEFFALKFKVTPDTLIPRWETELMVQILLDLRDNHSAYQVADIGTGAGNIACTLAKNRPAWQITATDICPRALVIAQENATTLALNNIEFIQSNWLQALSNKQFDVIISNPPYIREYDLHLTQGDVLFEPRHSLTYGPTGLEPFQIIVAQGIKLLKPQGFFIFEHGFDQAAALHTLFAQAGLNQIQTFQDKAGRNRVTLGYC